MNTELAGQPDLCNSSALRRASRCISRLYDEALAPCGLRTSQRSILVQVAKLASPTITELASALVLESSALNRNLKPLSREGLLTVEAGVEDRRSRQVRLTELGLKKLKESRSHWEKAQARFEAILGDDTSVSLRDLLGQISSQQFIDRFKA